MKYSDALDSACSRKGAVQDCLFLTIILLLSFISYIKGLGFYLDDYTYLKRFFTSSDQSILGLSQALYYADANTRTRPLEIFFLASQYWLFGPSPLAYHIVNSTLLLSSTILFYLVLCELGRPRIMAVAVPLVYALLPHYSTDRFWVVTFPHSCSISLYFLSLYADLRALDNQMRYLRRWKFLSLVSLISSGLAYEVALPLFALNPLLVHCRAKQVYGPVAGRTMLRQNWGALLASNILALVLLLAFKVVTTISLGNQTGLQFGIKGGYLDYLVFLVAEAIRVNYGTYGLGLPYVTWLALHLVPSWTPIIVAGLLGLIILGYLTYIAKQTDSMPSKASWNTFIVAGLIVFGLGYTVFSSTDRIGFSSAGLDNRVAIAAAIGVALSFVGILGRFSALFDSILSRKRTFCFLVALLCTFGSIVINTVASFWMTAYRQQQSILADIRERIPTLAGSTLILDGVCPEIGPAIVFKSHYDLAGALIMTYQDPALQADVVTPNLHIEENGISVRRRFYSYDRKLVLYNFARKTIHPLNDLEAARRYSQILSQDLGCLTSSWNWANS
jgi:hypothetical protein